ncbi:MAG: hypothetical protein ACRC7I_12360 [Selenomonadaceae bacterium]
MADDVIKIILNKLDRIETKQDQQAAQLTSIAERLAAIEVKQVQQDRINEKVCSLEEVKDRGTGAKNVLAWIVTTGISIVALISGFFRQG